MPWDFDIAHIYVTSLRGGAKEFVEEKRSAGVLFAIYVVYFFYMACQVVTVLYFRLKREVLPLSWGVALVDQLPLGNLFSSGFLQIRLST